MILRQIAVLFLTAASGAAWGCAPPPPSESPFPGGEIVDLSHPYDDATIAWPTSSPYRLEKVAEGITAGGYYYAANNLFTAEHAGTHIDAPRHFAETGMTVDQIPLERLVGPAMVVDVSEAASRDRDYQVSAADLEQAESANGRIPDGAILIVRTQFSQRWRNPADYLGTSARGESATTQLHFPGLHPDAARWLVANRRINAIGIDTASIDYGPSRDFASHRALAERNVPIFENLTFLERLPRRGASIMALPMKVTGGSGAPLRVVAILP